MFLTLLLTLLTFVNSRYICNPYQGCVDFSKVSTLTFKNGRTTTDFSGHTYPQVECVGNKEDCDKIISIQCVQKGLDDSKNTNWECKYQFEENSHIKVITDHPSCAGFRYKGDPEYIVKGSCILRTTVTNTYQSDKKNTESHIIRNTGDIGDWTGIITIIIIIIIFLMIISSINVGVSQRTTYYRERPSRYNYYHETTPRYTYYSYGTPMSPPSYTRVSAPKVTGRSSQTTHCQAANR